MQVWGLNRNHRGSQHLFDESIQKLDNQHTAAELKLSVLEKGRHRTNPFCRMVKEYITQTLQAIVCWLQLLQQVS